VRQHWRDVGNAPCLTVPVAAEAVLHRLGWNAVGRQWAEARHLAGVVQGMWYSTGLPDASKTIPSPAFAAVALRPGVPTRSASTSRRHLKTLARHTDSGLTIFGSPDSDHTAGFTSASATAYTSHRRLNHDQFGPQAFEDGHVQRVPRPLRLQTLPQQGVDFPARGIVRVNVCVTRGNVFTNGGWSHSCVTPMRSSPRPGSQSRCRWATRT